jgi:polyhydroxyalkanoate synthesis repressor PhaR
MPSKRSPADAGAAATAGKRTLKKYPNRRLYDTRSSSYITLADVKRMVLAHENFDVRDAKTGEDLTRSILLQIILEEESGGVPMFSSDTLAQIIRFYGHAMQGVMGTFFENNMRAFTEMQNRLAEQSKGLVDPKSFTPEMWTQFFGGQSNLMGPYLEQSKALFEKMQEQVQRSAAMFPGIAGFGSGKPKGE